MYLGLAPSLHCDGRCQRRNSDRAPAPSQRAPPGIYGPGRSVLDSLAKGPPALSASQRRRGQQRFISRCHAGDIATVLLASMDAPGPHQTPSAPPALRPDADAGPGASSSVRAGAGKGGFTAVFNVADDEPAPREEVEAFARELLGIAPVGTAPSSSSSSSSSSREAEGWAAGKGIEGGGSGDSGGGGGGGGALEEKRISNARVKAGLGAALRYPTYREGLLAIAAGATDPFLSWDDVRLLTGAAGPPRFS